MWAEAKQTMDDRDDWPNFRDPSRGYSSRTVEVVLQLGQHDLTKAWDICFTEREGGREIGREIQGETTKINLLIFCFVDRRGRHP